MLSLQRYEFKTNHEEWINTVKPRLGSDVSDSVHAAITATHENIEAYYMVRTEMRAAPLAKHSGGGRGRPTPRSFRSIVESM
ncbi:putative amidase [Helianthus annuus]|uniref:Amidase n=1 Tax=Helianthus annuus TaxID=4232 RepID=A0A9K3DHP9_HELAN|nr:putative amidase [Helianthus annuus]KAJ0812960.1 putative amidase [Helianthus annuus]